jgi:transketolase
MTKMGNMSIEALEDKARAIRRDIAKTIYLARAGHPGGSLSAADIVVALYYRFMRVDPGNPGWPRRDRFILSKGHASALIYAVLADKGFFPKAELATFRRIGGRLQGHPDMKKLPGLDMTTGSLGQGLSIGCGMALGQRMLGMDARVFVLLGDGEMDEGQVWEALMFAAHHRLGNLIAIIDRNRLQLDGCTEDVLALDPLEDKLAAFGWKVIETDGNRMCQVVGAIGKALACDVPCAIVAHTVKGKGVSFMENSAHWHGTAPNDEEYEAALKELGGVRCDW